MLQLSFRPFPLITTERLHLRGVAESDLEEMFRIRSDERALEHIHRAPATTMEEVASVINMLRGLEEKNEGITWGVTLRGEDKLIGTVCYWNLQPDNGRAELGYLLLPEYWGKGYMQEALDPILFYGFNMMKLHSLEAHVCPENTASLRLLERNGFVREGYLRENHFFNGRYWDMTIYSLIR
jgi:ribosomal-protein-alanine N-acetyltransferase